MQRGGQAIELRTAAVLVPQPRITHAAQRLRDRGQPGFGVVGAE